MAEFQECRCANQGRAIERRVGVEIKQPYVEGPWNS